MSVHQFQATSSEESGAEVHCVHRVECGSCAVALHFDCLPKMVQAEVSRLVRKAEAAANAANARVSSDDANDQDGEEKSKPEEEVDMLEPEQAPENGKKAVKKAKKELDPLQTITLPMCFMCSKEGGRKCFVCKKVEKEGQSSASPSLSKVILIHFRS